MIIDDEIELISTKNMNPQYHSVNQPFDIFNLEDQKTAI